jgi:hypothetical protein
MFDLAYLSLAINNRMDALMSPIKSMGPPVKYDHKQSMPVRQLEPGKDQLPFTMQVPTDPGLKLMQGNIDEAWVVAGTVKDEEERVGVIDME